MSFSLTLTLINIDIGIFSYYLIKFTFTFQFFNKVRFACLWHQDMFCFHPARCFSLWAVKRCFISLHLPSTKSTLVMVRTQNITWQGQDCDCQDRNRKLPGATPGLRDSEAGGPTRRTPSPDWGWSRWTSAWRPGWGGGWCWRPGWRTRSRVVHLLSRTVPRSCLASNLTP